MYIHTYTYIHTYIRIYIHTYIHTYIQGGNEAGGVGLAWRSETPVKELSDLLQVSGGPRTGLRIISPELLKREGRGRPQELLRVALEPPADNAYFTQVLFLLFVLFLTPADNGYASRCLSLARPQGVRCLGLKV